MEKKKRKVITISLNNDQYTYLSNIVEKKMVFLEDLGIKYSRFSVGQILKDILKEKMEQKK